MLHGQDGRRTQEGHLFVVDHRLEGRTDGNLGLAKADISAQQTVHRTIAFHVLLDLHDRLFLIRGQLIGELIFKFFLHRRILGIRMTDILAAQCVELDQPLCQLLHLLADLAACPLPFSAAQFVELDADAFFCDIAANELKL